MKKKNRAIEIFSMSALDLFASAMGAFVLLSVMMLPYYFKGKEFEESIGKLAQEKQTADTAAASAAEAAAQALAKLIEPIEIETKSLEPEKASLTAAIEAGNALTSKVESLEKKIDEQKEIAKKRTESKEKKKKAKVTFRFLGLKTDRDSYLILVDGSARVKKFAKNLPEILSGIVSVFGPEKEFAVSFYRSDNRQLRQRRWPANGFAPGTSDNRSTALKFMQQAYDRMGGGSATFQALNQAVTRETADSVILVSDGFILPSDNAGRHPRDVVQQISRVNRAGVEVHAIAVGVFYKSKLLAEFLNNLSLNNKGDFKAIPP